MLGRASILCCAGVCLTLAGCGEQNILRYQGRPAQTAQECEAAYKDARARGSYQPAPTTGAGLFGAALGKGIAKGMIESAYESCLARVSAATPQGAYRAAVVAEQNAARYPAATSGTCQRGLGVMQGGSGYCINY